jgi:hypothetical protein
MVVAFEVEECVYKKEADKICIRPFKEWRIRARFFQVEENFPFILVEREREYVCRIIFSAISIVKLAGLARA